MALYDYPTSVNFSEGLTGLFQYLNDVTNSWFSNMILIAVYLIFATGFYLSSRQDFFGGLAVGGFAVFIVGLLFFIAGLISGITFSLVIAVTIISFTLLWFGQQANIG